MIEFGAELQGQLGAAVQAAAVLAVDELVASVIIKKNPSALVAVDIVLRKTTLSERAIFRPLIGTCPDHFAAVIATCGQCVKAFGTEIGIVELKTGFEIKLCRAVRAE